MILNQRQMRAVGCLVGGAVGDALGYAVEFYEDAQIFRTYGENGITDYRLYHGVAQISDDTQMTLFTAEGLLSHQGDATLLDSIYRAYLNWYQTQKSSAPISDRGLLRIPALYSTRAPGATCMSALEGRVCGTIEAPINHSKGCGGIMRVAPIAIYCYNKGISLYEADMLAARAAAITHGHELGYIPAALFVHTVYRILEGKALMEAVRDAMEYGSVLFAGCAYLSDALRLLEKAIALAQQAVDGVDDLELIRELGEGWVAEETLAIAVYCCLRHQDSFEQTVIAAVNHSGDSDSTGAVAGNIIGAYLGAKRIPKKYLTNLELLDTITEMSKKLCDA